MVQASGQIIITDVRNACGQLVERSYEWAGGPTAMVNWWMLQKLSRRKALPRPGERFRLGPLHLLCHEKVFIYNAVIVEMAGPIARLRFWLRRITRLAELVYVRLILTAEVWGLATCDSGRIPSWRDLYVVKWLDAKPNGNASL